MIGWNQEKSHFSTKQGSTCLKQEFFRWVTNIHEHKRYYYTFDNSLLFTESICEHYTNLSTLNHNVRFLPCQHRGVGIMQYVYALNPACIVLIIPGHSRREVPRQAVDIGLIREYKWRFIAPWHTLINITAAWNFNSLFRALFNFLHIRFCELQKHRNNTPWKKCYSLLRWPCLLQDVLKIWRLLFVKTNRQQ